MFLTAVPPRRERREGAGTDLCSECQWSHPRSRARRCGTWPPSGLSAWPCCCGWHRAEPPPSRASPSPQPGSPPVTEYRSSPSLAEQAAYERRSCQSQHDREKEGEREGGRAESAAWLSLCPGYLLRCGKLGHLSRKLLQLTAGLAESSPEASTAPASPPASPGPRLQDAAVVTGTVQMSHE